MRRNRAITRILQFRCYVLDFIGVQGNLVLRTFEPGCTGSPSKALSANSAVAQIRRAAEIRGRSDPVHANPPPAWPGGCICRKYRFRSRPFCPWCPLWPIRGKIQRPPSAGKSLIKPSDITSTANAAKIKPMSRVMTLMPVLPSTRAMGCAKVKANAVARAITKP